MTQAQKLEALIERAIEGGWSKYGVNAANIAQEAMHDCYEPEYSIFDVLFDKDFAHALFRGGPVGATVLERVGSDYEETTWGYEYEAQLQVAVISDNPIDYYYEQVFGKV